MTKTVAQSIAYLRAQKGMTQRELAQAAGLSWSQISRYESGAVKPRLGSLLKLAKGLGVTPDVVWPMFGEVDAEAPEEKEAISLNLSDFARKQIRDLADRKGITFDQALQLVLLMGMKMRFDQDPELMKAMEKEHPDAYQFLEEGIANDGAPPSDRNGKKR